eukprot:365733-Chlamydomonas_euryale.AAC.8
MGVGVRAGVEAAESAVGACYARPGRRSWRQMRHGCGRASRCRSSGISRRRVSCPSRLTILEVDEAWVWTYRVRRAAATASPPQPRTKPTPRRRRASPGTPSQV